MSLSVDETAALEQEVAGHVRSGRLDDAVRSARTLCAVCREAFGPSDIRHAKALLTLASLLVRIGARAEAKEIFEQVVAIAHSAPTTPGTPLRQTLLQALMGLASIHSASREFAAAYACHREALELQEALAAEHGGPENSQKENVFRAGPSRHTDGASFDRGASETPVPFLGTAVPCRVERPPKGLFEGLSRLLPFGRQRAKDDTEPDAVQCSVFAPPKVCPATTVLIQVFAHLPIQTEEARTTAREHDGHTGRRGYTSLETEIRRGSRLTFHLAMEGLVVDEPVQAIVWTACAQPVQFAAYVPGDRTPGLVMGTVNVLMNQIPVGRMRFSLEVVSEASEQASLLAEPISDAACHYRKAFALYAWEDRGRIDEWVRLLLRSGLKVFVDDPGLAVDVRNKTLARSDLCLLFWSAAAVRSDHVLSNAEHVRRLRERDRAGLPQLLSIALDSSRPYDSPFPPFQAPFLTNGSAQSSATEILYVDNVFADQPAPAKRLSSAPTRAMRGDPRMDSPAAPKDSDPFVGTVFNGYRVESPIGSGSFGCVYKAVDEQLCRTVAVKFLIDPGNRTSAKDFLREARTLARASRHPSVVQIFQYGVHQQRNYLVMEYVPANLNGLIRDTPNGLPAATALPIMADMADAVEYAHQQGILHQDIKPANILYDAELRKAKLADFGLAQFFRGGSASDTFVVGGTPCYMSPEQIDSKDIGPRSDVFSLGVTFYELLSGGRPFDGDSAQEVMLAIREHRMTPLAESRPDINRDLAAIVDRALERRETARYVSAGEMAAALRRLLAQLP